MTAGRAELMPGLQRPGAGDPNGRAQRAPAAPHRAHRAPRGDPGALPPEARLRELGALLADGYRRARLRWKALDESGEAEAESVGAESRESARTAPGGGILTSDSERDRESQDPEKGDAGQAGGVERPVPDSGPSIPPTNPDEREPGPAESPVGDQPRRAGSRDPDLSAEVDRMLREGGLPF